jgi:hypothetical protein
MPHEKKYPSPAARQAAYRRRNAEERAATLDFHRTVLRAACRLTTAVRAAAEAGDPRAQMIPPSTVVRTLLALASDFESRARRVQECGSGRREE